MLERIAPWLLDLGSWMFGALIAFNLLILGALLTVGPVDAAVIVSTAALALVLPVNVTGFFMLKLSEDLKKLSLDEVAKQAFKDVGFVDDRDSSPETREKLEKKRTSVVLRYAYLLLALSAVLTLISITAALWHMAWWIGVLFVAMTFVSQFAIVGAIVSAGPNKP